MEKEKVMWALEREPVYSRWRGDVEGEERGREGGREGGRESGR